MIGANSPVSTHHRKNFCLRRAIVVADSIDQAKERIWTIVAAIPKGKVATYGQIAGLAGLPRHARLVGRTLSQLPSGSKLPWHRVINSQGRITNPNPARQRERLEAEGITLVGGKVRLKDYQWQTGS